MVSYTLHSETELAGALTIKIQYFMVLFTSNLLWVLLFVYPRVSITTVWIDEACSLLVLQPSLPFMHNE